MSGLIHSFLNRRRLTGMACKWSLLSRTPRSLAFLDPRLFRNKQDPRGGWLADSSPLIALLPHQPRGLGAKEGGQDLLWVGRWELIHFYWLALDGLPRPPWTERSLNSSMFGNEVSHIHPHSSSR
ncbi:unnamed protein product [Rangifer tarandus platyrhynchus]|uniref:Uncharacterized protein n=1 Tax=Rangifer tarandus platyrhynchus TaxID=3082113 RepID=A0ABN8Z5P9_RANTA|nr:unnamed protein product [Rangifer tarandus platyrhynchus]